MKDTMQIGGYGLGEHYAQVDWTLWQWCLLWKWCPLILELLLIDVGVDIHFLLNFFFFGNPQFQWTKSWFSIWATKFYTWKCVNLGKKLSRDKTVWKILHGVQQSFHVPNGKSYTWPNFLYIQLWWWWHILSMPGCQYQNRHCIVCILCMYAQENWNWFLSCVSYIVQRPVLALEILSVQRPIGSKSC